MVGSQSAEQMTVRLDEGLIKYFQNMVVYDF